MNYFKRLFWLMLVGLAFGGVYSDDVEKTEGEKPQERFLDDFFDGLDVNVQKFVNEGSSVIQKVQEFKGQHGTGSQIIKTEITSYSSGNHNGFPVGARFKRSLFEDVMGNVKDKVSHITDKFGGAVADGYNIGFDELNKLKGKIQNKLEN